MRISDAEMDRLIDALAVARANGCPKPALRLVLDRASEMTELTDRVALYGRYCMWYWSPVALYVDRLMRDGGTAADVEALRDFLPLQKERRRPLMGKRMLPALESLEAWLAEERWRDIEVAAGWEDWSAVERTAWDTIREIKTFGRYISIKMAWCLAWGEGWGDLSTLHPDEGLYIRKSFADLVGEDDLPPATVDALAYDVLNAANDVLPEPVSLFEIESFVCENRAGRAGKRYAIREFDEELEAYGALADHLTGGSLPPWPGDDWLDRRARLFPHQALGERHGWSRPRAELDPLQRATGIVWSDVDYDWAASTPPLMIAPRGPEPR